MKKPLLIILGAAYLALGAGPAKKMKKKPAIDPKEIIAVIRPHLDGVRHCYEKALKRDGTMSGKLAMTWKIERSGKTSDVHESPESTIKDAELGSCVKAEIETWVFPKPTETVTVNYPFVFSPL
jgi:hypothetical protein